MDLKRMQELAGIKEANNNDINTFRDSINKVNQWTQKTFNESVKTKTPLGDDMVNILSDIDYVIAVKNTSDRYVIVKLEKSELKRATIFERNGKLNLYMDSNNRRFNDGTISVARIIKRGFGNNPEEESITNGIVALSYKGQLIGNDIKTTEILPNTISPDVEDDIEYIIWGEGPTFTNSQFGGHGFYDWNLYSLVKQGTPGHKATIENGQLIMVTPFDPNDYFHEDSMASKEEFDLWWKLNNKDNKIKKEGGEEMPWDSTLLNKKGKWYIVDSGDLEQILQLNDGTPQDQKQELLNTYKNG